MQARNRRPAEAGMSGMESTTSLASGVANNSGVVEEPSQQEQPPPPPTRSGNSFVDATLYDPQMSRGDKALLTRGQATLDNSFSFRASTQTFGQHWETMNRKQRCIHLEDYLRSKYADSPYLDNIRVFLTGEILDKPRGDKHVVWNGYFIERITELNVPCSKMQLLTELDGTVEGGAPKHHLVTNPVKPTGLQQKPLVIRFAKRCFSAEQNAGVFEHVESTVNGDRTSSGDGTTQAPHTAQKVSNFMSNPKCFGRRTSKVAACSTSNSNSFGAMRNRLRRERQAFYVLDNNAFE